MHELLNDPVEVTVDFCGRHVRPTSVRWAGRAYAVERVNLVHTAREGAKRIYYFSVSNNTNFMKLKLDTEMLEWRLVEWYCE